MINEKISDNQSLFLIFLMKFIMLIFNVTITENIKELGFILISYVIGGIVNYLLVLPFLIIIKKEEYINNLKNNKILSLIFVLLLMTVLLMRLSSFTSFYRVGIFPEMSNTFFAVTCLLVVMYNVRKGIEGISRSSSILLPLFLISITIITSLILKNGLEKKIEIALGGNLFKGFLNQAMFSSATSLDGVFLFLLSPYIQNKDKIQKKYSFCLLGYYAFLIFMTLAIILSYGKYASNLNFIYYISARNIGLGTFIERFESAHVALWVLCVIPFFSTIIIMVQDLLGKKGKISLFIICVLLVIGNFFVTKKYTYLYNIFTSRIVNITLGITIFIIPYLVLIFCKRRKNKNEKIKS